MKKTIVTILGLSLIFLLSETAVSSDTKVVEKTLPLSVKSANPHASKFKKRPKPKHEHGIGHAQIILKDQVLTLEVVGTAFDFFGFEEKPKNEAQKAKIKSVLSSIEKFESILEVSKDANCVNNKFAIAGQVFDGLAGYGFEGGARVSLDGLHSDVRFFWLLQCFDPNSLKGIKLKLASKFESLTKVVVETIKNDEPFYGDLTKSETAVPGFK